MISNTSLSTPSSVKLWTMSPVMVPEVATELEETVELEEVLELLEETNGVMVTVGEDFSIVADFSNLSV